MHKPLLSAVMSAPASPPRSLPKFHPATVIAHQCATPDCRGCGKGFTYTIADATTGVCVFGATGSGKTSGTGAYLARRYLGGAAEMGACVLVAKLDEVAQWRQWARETGRAKDLVVFDATGDRYRFNFLEWESSHASDGGGLTINVVALLEEVILALQPEKSSGSGENIFWEDALHQLLVNTVELMKLAGEPLRLDYMRDIVRSAPISREQAKDPAWTTPDTPCWYFLNEAEKNIGGGDKEALTDYQECRAYWLDDFANLSDRTRSIITLMFTKLAQPFTLRPLRRLFSQDTTITPEATFDGKIIVVALPTQDFKLVGKIAALVWKYCTQVALMRRAIPPPGEYLRPVAIWADEAAENFLSRGDSAFQAVARASAGCTVYLAQNVSQYRKRLGDNDGFESFISNLQTKFFHQVTGPTTIWASELLGQRWVNVPSITSGVTNPAGVDGLGGTSGSASISEQRRFLVEPSRFVTLRRGGDAYRFIIDAICYKGGYIFGCTAKECAAAGTHQPRHCNGTPYTELTFKQKK